MECYGRYNFQEQPDQEIKEINILEADSEKIEHFISAIGILVLDALFIEPAHLHKWNGHPARYSTAAQLILQSKRPFAPIVNNHDYMLGSRDDSRKSINWLRLQPRLCISANDIHNILEGRYSFQDLILEGTEGNALLLAVQHYQAGWEAVKTDYYALKYDPYQNILFWEDWRQQHWRLDKYHQTQRRPALDRILGQACQIWVFQIVKSHTTLNQQDQYEEQEFGGNLDIHSVISNSATNFIGLRMDAYGVFRYERKTDPSIWYKKCDWDSSRLPDQIVERINKRLSKTDHLKSKE